jgi:hypothetical protein
MKAPQKYASATAFRTALERSFAPHHSNKSE